jgi:hypothetical protein
LAPRAAPRPCDAAKNSACCHDRVTQKHDFHSSCKIIQKDDDIRAAAPHRDAVLTHTQERHMKKTVLTFGLISGLIMSILMGGSLLLADKIGSSHSMLLGYTIMVASFLLIYFGIRSYRDNTLACQISFGRAFACGILITIISSVCYVVMWEVLYFNFMPHFMDSYFAAQIHKVQSAGFDAATTAAQVAAIQHSQQLYQNPLVNMAYTLMEPLPVGLLMTLISAALLRRKAPTSSSSSANPALT